MEPMLQNHIHGTINPVLRTTELAFGGSNIGFAGSAVPHFRVGKEINSAALVADGYHARVDGLTSLGVLFRVA